MFIGIKLVIEIIPQYCEHIIVINIKCELLVYAKKTGTEHNYTVTHTVFKLSYVRVN